MEQIKQYIFTVVVAAIFCGSILALTGKKGTIGAVIKLLCGLFLSLVIVRPLTNTDILNFDIYQDFWQADAEAYASAGTEDASHALRSIIKQQCEAYILDKANSMGADLSFEVSLSLDDPPVPTEIRIQGNVSPYNKLVLRQFIEDNMGIPEERQLWT